MFADLSSATGAQTVIVGRSQVVRYRAGLYWEWLWLVSQVKPVSKQTQTLSLLHWLYIWLFDGTQKHKKLSERIEKSLVNMKYLISSFISLYVVTKSGI